MWILIVLQAKLGVSDDGHNVGEFRLYLVSAGCKLT